MPPALVVECPHGRPVREVHEVWFAECEICPFEWPPMWEWRGLERGGMAARLPFESPGGREEYHSFARRARRAGGSPRARRRRYEMSDTKKLEQTEAEDLDESEMEKYGGSPYDKFPEGRTTLVFGKKVAEPKTAGDFKWQVFKLDGRDRFLLIVATSGGVKQYAMSPKAGREIRDIVAKGHGSVVVKRKGLTKDDTEYWHDPGDACKGHECA